MEYGAARSLGEAAPVLQCFSPTGKYRQFAILLSLYTKAHDLWSRRLTPIASHARDLQSAPSVRIRGALRVFASTWQSHGTLQVVKSTCYTYPEKAGVGG
jgi:hypothetical protein